MPFLKNIFCYTFLSLLISVQAMAQAPATDTTTPPKKKKVVFDLPHQLRFGADIYHPILNTFTGDHKSYEFQADYYIGNEVYADVEGGWGNADIDYDNLKYNSKNSFIRVGVDKCMLQRLTGKDWDMAFIGARYGIAFIDRGNATYVTSDSAWGPTTGSVAAQTFTAHWLEITGGVRVELWSGIFAGWNVRGKFMINQSAFKELPPAYIAGYGKGDKSTAFDFNFYISYAIRWKKNKK